ncbi:MAG: hypothetical protein LV481_16290 [Methylacidiphilales bacterium]|nr:hypothetical protein [Candidatus Methylacidiphilales bacterium]
MQIHVKKNSLLLVAFMASLSTVLAQNAPAGPPPSGAQNPPGPSGDVDNSVRSILDYNFNHKAGDQTAAKGEQDVAEAIADKIKALDVLRTPGLDDPEIRARFETYVSLPAVPDRDIKDYFSKMSQISDLLKQNDTFGAWKLLYALSEYKDLDAGISRELANRVEGVWNSNRAQDGLAQVNTKLQDNIETYGHNADMIADDLHEQALQDGKGQNAGASSGGGNQSNSSSSNALMNVNPNADPAAAEQAVMPTMSGALQRKMELTDEYLKLLEARAKIKLNEISADRMSDQDKSDFSDYIKMLYDTHRYYHVIIAADFYRALFNVADLDLPGNINTQANAPTLTSPHAADDMISVTSKSMGLNGQVPINAITAAGNAVGFTNPLGPAEGDHPLSISEEVTSALEINNRVNEAIEVFKYKAGKGEIAEAADQLQEAFIANEYHPALQGLNRDDKEKVGDFLAKLDVLKNQLEARDFEQVEGQLDDIKKLASDFDSTKPLALVNAVKLESRLRIGKAKLLAQGGQLDESMKEFATAAEEWPGNPDLQTSASAFFNTEDAQNENTSEFDQLVKEQNYREIFDKKLAFAVAVRGDATREQQLKDALTIVQKAEMASEKANMLVMNGDVDGAWETIELAAKDWPDDTKLNKLLANLSERSADFVSAVDKARDAEAKKELGYSLTWYVNAQSIYPASTIAHEGIDRVSKQILSPDAETAPSSSASTPASEVN